GGGGAGRTTRRRAGNSPVGIHPILARPDGGGNGAVGRPLVSGGIGAARGGRSTGVPVCAPCCAVLRNRPAVEYHLRPVAEHQRGEKGTASGKAGGGAPRRGEP